MPPSQDSQGLQLVPLTFSLPLPCVECQTLTQEGVIVAGQSYERGVELIPLCDRHREQACSETAEGGDTQPEKSSS